MAEGLNKALLIGNLGAEPELRFTQSNRAVLKFRLATTESYMADNNERKEVTHWHNVVLWGKRAEALSKILVKGSSVYVEGRIETRSYDDKDGIKRSITEITANNLILLGKRDANGAGQARTQSSGGGFGKPSAPQKKFGDPVDRDEIPDADFGGGGGADDDIPFDAVDERMH